MGWRIDTASRRTAWSLAAALSTLLYFMPPLIHGRPLVIELLYDCAGADPFGEWAPELLRDVPGGLLSVLFPAVLTVVLVVQLCMVFALQRVLRARKKWRALAGTGVILIFGPIAVATATDAVVPVGFRMADPFLTRSRRQFPERADWRVECTLDNYEIDPIIDIPPDGLVQRFKQAWIRRRSRPELTTLTMPGCKISPTKLSDQRVMELEFYAAASGRAIYVHNEGFAVTPKFEQWWYVDSPSSPPMAIEAPAGADATQPALSSNGEWIGWILESGGEDSRARVVLRSLKSGETVTIDSEELFPGRYWLLGVNIGDKTVLVARKGYKEAVLLDFSGRLLSKPITLGAEQESVVQRVLLRQGGWIGWYGQPLRNTVEWSLPAGKKKYVVQGGTRINSVDVSPDGRLIAIGTDGEFFGSRMEAAAFVLDANTGAEMFRKYLPRRCWVQVTFLGDDYFAYSSSPSHFAVGGAEFKVLRVPR